MRNELKNGIILSITVILIILVVYLTTAVFMTGEIGSKKSSEKKTTTTNAASSYENKILASKVFDQTPETYKVQDVSDDLKSAITSYSGNTKLYLVNKDEAINKYVSSDTDNVKPDNSSSLKVKKEALLTISNESVTSYVTNESEIIDELK